MGNKKILSAIYEQVLEELPPSSKYKDIQDEFIRQKELFLKDITTQDLNSLERLTDLIHEMNDEQNRQLFYKGFSIAVQLFIEATDKK